MRDFFTLPETEQRGIVVLLFILFLLGVINELFPILFSPKTRHFDSFHREIKTFVVAQRKMDDSLELKRLQKAGKLTFQEAKKILHPVPFYPDTVTIEQWVKMGLLSRQAKTILHYLAKGGRFRKKEDLKKIHGLSEAEYAVLKSYIRIPPVQKPKHPDVVQQFRRTEINSADTQQLVKNLHLPAWIARRIIKYRHLLGDFYSPEQLQEVYGLKKTTYQHIRPYVFADTTQIRRIDLNSATFKQLLHHPYITYEMTKKLMHARERIHVFRDFGQVKQMTGFPDTILIKIRHYLYLRPFKN